MPPVPIMEEEPFSVAVDEQTTVSCTRLEAQVARLLFLYAPGAGSNLRDSFGGFLGQQLPAHGVSLVRFQFPYMERGRRSPDPTAMLQKTWCSVIEAVVDLERSWW